VLDGSGPADANVKSYEYLDWEEALALFAEIKGFSIEEATSELRDEGRIPNRRWRDLAMPLMSMANSKSAVLAK